MSARAAPSVGKIAGGPEQAGAWVTDLRDLVGPDGDRAGVDGGAGHFVAAVVEAATIRALGRWQRRGALCAAASNFPGNFAAVRRSCLHDDAEYARAPTRRHVAKWFGAPVKSVLVAYGLPPNRVHLFGATGRDLHTEWKFDPKTFNGKTRQKFEQLLRTALNSFLMSEVPEIAHTHYRFITSAGELRAALHGGRYTHIVYYGHAVDDGATLKPLHKITVTELRHLLQGSGVDHIDLLGCKSTTFASQLASAMPNLNVGNLRGKRFDDIEVDLRSMQLTNFTIVPQVVFHFSPAPAAK